MTYGADNSRPVEVIDPVQMTQQAPYQEALYISARTCSSVLTTTNELSPGHGDHPYDTVPNQVYRLFKAQQLHDRKHYDARRRLTAGERSRTPYVDHLRPIVADGEAGHGGPSAVLKLAQLFAEKGAAGVHFGDQLHGGRKCGHLLGKVLVPVQEHIDRLVAARFQWDVMGCENLIIAKTDAENCPLISSAIDIRDQEFILGMTEEVEPLAETLQQMEAMGASGSELDAYEMNWVTGRRLVTFDEGQWAQYSMFVQYLVLDTVTDQHMALCSCYCSYWRPNFRCKKSIRVCQGNNKRLQYISRHTA